MQFTVPQFIDVEDKIIGPITTRQFIIFLVTGLLVFIAYKLATFTVFVFLTVIFLGSGAVIALLRVNGQPFHFFLLNLLQTWQKPKIRIWQKEITAAELKEAMRALPAPPPKVEPRKTPLSTSKLAELTLVVNTGGVYRPEE